MARCKAPEILSREAYFWVRRTVKDEGNAADGRFSTACYCFCCMIRIFICGIFRATLVKSGFSS
jgi:hypothetical protein